MSLLLRLASAAALAIGIGLFSAYQAVRSGFAGGEVSNGPWRTSFVTGSSDADMYTRARGPGGGPPAPPPPPTGDLAAPRRAEGPPPPPRPRRPGQGPEPTPRPVDGDRH